jgi:hypothetical protein
MPSCCENRYYYALLYSDLLSSLAVWLLAMENCLNLHSAKLPME